MLCRLSPYWLFDEKSRPGKAGFFALVPMRRLRKVRRRPIKTALTLRFVRWNLTNRVLLPHEPRAKGSHLANQEVYQVSNYFRHI